MKNYIKIMGILNVTPDSFSDGGKFFSVKRAVAYAKKMIKDGADIIDVGGESTGPGSRDVSLKEELDRVIPVIKLLRGAAISIDTHKAEVARQAIAAGARMVNDVTALRGDPEMARVVAHAGVPVVLMYSKDPTARATRTKKKYRDVVSTVMHFLEERIAYALSQGIHPDQIIIDPGMGAFISGEPKYSYEVLRRLDEFKKLGYPILVGASRKSFLPGTVQERDGPSLFAHLVAAKNGASIVRTHAVALSAKLF